MNTGSVGDTLGIVGDENNQMWEFLLALPDMDEGFSRALSAECPDSPSARKEELARRGRGQGQTTAIMIFRGIITARSTACRTARP